MVCPYCGTETYVKNSRHQKRNNQVWRRRACTKCQSVFTTHEVIDLPSVFMVEKNGSRRPFNPAAITGEIMTCLKDHHSLFEASNELTAVITQNLIKKASGGLIMAHDITIETAKTLKRFDKQAYLRFLADHPSVQ